MIFLLLSSIPHLGSIEFLSISTNVSLGQHNGYTEGSLTKIHLAIEEDNVVRNEPTLGLRLGDLFLILCFKMIGQGMRRTLQMSYHPKL